MKIWFASGNDHKRKELDGIFTGHSLKIPKDDNIFFEPEETGASFFENALIKAKALYTLVKAPVLADDSGLCVNALDGRPGIYSSRYGEKNGTKLSDLEKNMLLLQEMSGKTDRAAAFVCAFVLFINPNKFFLAQETLEGTIISQMQGKNGFGYDPLFFVPEKNCTLAELDESSKNSISHRGKAARAIYSLLNNTCLKND
ncbi:MAG: RdgB/HAM1 family non-canonical purine NTP pyrophosphatase [Spirochaetaceae bacterium]|jgi:XTP/dITP diphosphohydrolase|nr:RdgB/HAM1 family non-canonical purine NTP pyrophosphatase [Spirochaetaceae bacterium]